MIFESTMRKMCGEVTINETSGYLFHSKGDFRFAYRLASGIAVDEISPNDRIRMWRWFGRIVGYKLSGKPEDGYGNIEYSVPRLPIVDCILMHDDLERFDRRVVLYQGKPAVIQDNELFYRDIEYTTDPGTKIPRSFGNCIKVVKVCPDNNGFSVHEAKIPPTQWAFYGQADAMLTRNGII